MISRFQVQNFKALRDVTLDLTPMHVLIGPNDSGKTSILEALYAVCRSVDYNFSEAFSGRWTGNELVWERDPGQRVSFNLSAEGNETSIAYELCVEFVAGRREVRHVSERIESSALGQVSAVIDSQNWPRSLVAKSNAAGFRSNPQNWDKAARLVHGILSGVEIYRWIPRFLGLPNAPDDDRARGKDRGPQMDASGFGLALCLDFILGYDRALFGRLEDQFKEFFPEIETIRFVQEPAFLAPLDFHEQALELKKQAGKGIYFQLKNGPLIPASQASDGTLLVLAYLTVLHLPEKPRVLLIEEPENGVHPARLQEVLSILRDLTESQNHTQVVLATHSPYVVSLFSPDEVTLCVKDSDGAVQTRRLSESKLVSEQLDVFTLGEIWTGDGDEQLMEPTIVTEESDK